MLKDGGGDPTGFHAKDRDGGGDPTEIYNKGGVGMD